MSICLFCNIKQQDFDKNMIHMQTSHGFFISEHRYCTNPEGLVKYLAEKINIGLLCLYCENQGTKGFKSAEALRSHMVSKGHCFMNTDNFDEYIKHFDFTEQFKELEIEYNENGSASAKDNEAIIEIASDDDESEGSEEWEDEDEEGAAKKPD